MNKRDKFYTFSFGILVILLLLLFGVTANAGGLQASFESSRFEGLTRHTTIFESWGDVDPSGNLVDHSGENLLTDRTEFDDWSESGTCAVTADTAKNPVDGSFDADLLDNTGGANTDHRYLYSGSSTTEPHTGSVWVRVDTPHTITVVLNENGVGAIDTLDFSATTTWRRVSVSGSGTGAGAVGLLLYPGESGTSTGTAYFYGAQIVENDRYRTGMGTFLNPADQSVTKPDHDLAPTNSPTAALTSLECRGNHCAGREYDETNYYSKAHHDSMNIFDTDHTITILFTQATTADGFDRLFCHGENFTSGVQIYSNAASYIRTRYSKAASHSDVVKSTSTVADGSYHIIQSIRNNNSGIIYYDGDDGAPVDLTGLGIDGNSTFTVGTYSDLTDTTKIWEGDISYIRIDAEALSEDELAYEREVLLGTAAHTGFDSPNWDFDRSTSATKEFTAGSANAYSPKLMTVAADTPRVADGVLIESQSTNLITYSDDFDAAGTDWTNTRCSVTNDTAIFLDGTTTADTIHEDATAADTHFVRSRSISGTSGSRYTYSVYIKANNRTWALFYIWGSGVLAAGYYVNLINCSLNTSAGAPEYGSVEAYPDGWCKCSVTDTAGSSGNFYGYVFIADGDGSNSFNGLDQDSLYVMGAQVEEMPFPTSLIHTDGSEVTRTADDATMDPHEVNSTRLVLPEEFCNTCTVKYLTMYMEAKCEFSSSSDVGENRVLFGISGNTGTADSSHNRAMIYVESTGELVSSVTDDSGTAHSISTAVDPINYDDWFSVRSVFDFSDLSRIDMWIQQCPGTCIPADESNAGMVYTNNAGTATFDTTNTKIRLGQWYSGTINANCKFRNIRITPDYTPAP